MKKIGFVWSVVIVLFLAAALASQAYAQDGSGALSEVVTVPFTAGIQGATSAGNYAGDVEVTVEGSGQAADNCWTDAFYLYGCGDLPTTPVVPSGDPYDFILHMNDVSVKYIVSPIPAYTSTHKYVFAYQATGGKIKLAVGDTGTNDNKGAYTITLAKKFQITTDSYSIPNYGVPEVSKAIFASAFDLSSEIQNGVWSVKVSNYYRDAVRRAADHGLCVGYTTSVAGTYASITGIASPPGYPSSAIYALNKNQGITDYLTGLHIYQVGEQYVRERNSAANGAKDKVTQSVAKMKAFIDGGNKSPLNLLFDFVVDQGVCTGHSVFPYAYYTDQNKNTVFSIYDSDNPEVATPLTVSEDGKKWDYRGWNQNGFCTYIDLSTGGQLRGDSAFYAFNVPSYAAKPTIPSNIQAGRLVQVRPYGGGIVAVAHASIAIPPGFVEGGAIPQPYYELSGTMPVSITAMYSATAFTTSVWDTTGSEVFITVTNPVSGSVDRINIDSRGQKLTLYSEAAGYKQVEQAIYDQGQNKQEYVQSTSCTYPSGSNINLGIGTGPSFLGEASIASDVTLNDCTYKAITKFGNTDYILPQIVGGDTYTLTRGSDGNFVKVIVVAHDVGGNGSVDDTTVLYPVGYVQPATPTPTATSIPNATPTPTTAPYPAPTGLYPVSGTRLTTGQYYDFGWDKVPGALSYTFEIYHEPDHTKIWYGLTQDNIVSITMKSDGDYTYRVAAGYAEDHNLGQWTSATVRFEAATPVATLTATATNTLVPTQTPTPFPTATSTPTPRPTPQDFRILSPHDGETVWTGDIILTWSKYVGAGKYFCSIETENGINSGSVSAAGLSCTLPPKVKGSYNVYVLAATEDGTTLAVTGKVLIHLVDDPPQKNQVFLPLVVR